MRFDDRTTTPADAAAWCRANEPEHHRFEDAEPDPPFTMPTPPDIDHSPIARAIRHYFGGNE